MLRPYKKLAKDSLKRARLSCMSWKCIMFASRSAMASDSSAKAGSNVLRGNGVSPSPAERAESRKDDRDEGRSGVVGRDVRVLELGRRFPVVSWSICAACFDQTGREGGLTCAVASR